jgi:hypothetical protein
MKMDEAEAAGAVQDDGPPGDGYDDPMDDYEDGAGASGFHAGGSGSGADGEAVTGGLDDDAAPFDSCLQLLRWRYDLSNCSNAEFDDLLRILRHKDFNPAEVRRQRGCSALIVSFDLD